MRSIFLILVVFGVVFLISPTKIASSSLSLGLIYGAGETSVSMTLTSPLAAKGKNLYEFKDLLTHFLQINYMMETNLIDIEDPFVFQQFYDSSVFVNFLEDVSNGNTALLIDNSTAIDFRPYSGDLKSKSLIWKYISIGDVSAIFRLANYELIFLEKAPIELVKRIQKNEKIKSSFITDPDSFDGSSIVYFSLEKEKVSIFTVESGTVIGVGRDDKKDYEVLDFLIDRISSLAIP